jgi:hypothetical protein
VVSPLPGPGTYSQTADHYSLLQTIEDGFGITNLLGNAAAVTPDQQSLCSGRCRFGLEQSVRGRHLHVLPEGGAAIDHKAVPAAR